jgi:hypothetical protein
MVTGSAVSIAAASRPGSVSPTTIVDHAARRVRRVEVVGFVAHDDGGRQEHERSSSAA